MLLFFELILKSSFLYFQKFRGSTCHHSYTCGLNCILHSFFFFIIFSKILLIIFPHFFKRFLSIFLAVMVQMDKNGQSTSTKIGLEFQINTVPPRNLAWFAKKKSCASTKFGLDCLEKTVPPQNLAWFVKNTVP